MIKDKGKKDPANFSEKNVKKLEEENAAKAMGLSIAGVDMLPSEKGPLVLEVNSSPGLEGIEHATQIDIAEKIIEYIETNAQKNKKDKVGV